MVENSPVPQDRRVWHEATSLTAAGWHVTAIAPFREGGDQPPREVLEGVEIRRFTLRTAERGAPGYLLEYGQALWKLWRQLRRVQREGPPDVVHACNPPDFLLLCALGARRRGAALVFDHHDLVPEMLTERFASAPRAFAFAVRAAERLAFRLADVSLEANDTFRHTAIERAGAAPENVFVVRNGPRLKHFTPVDPDPSLARGKQHLLVYVGLMGPQDGVDQGLVALADLAGRRDDWHARFLGDGPTLPELQRLAMELGIADRVEFAGYVADPEVRRAICSASVCFVPDPSTPLTNASTLVKIAEYMALSRPVVAFDLVESRVTAGDAAVYAPPGDTEAFARLIDELLDDPAARRRMGAIGRERIEGGLAWDHSEPQLLRAYERARELAQARVSRA
jgi:glycosyltransferase involved in cell wall biosynthesis